MPYTSIFGGKGAGVVPNSGNKANPFVGHFTPGQYFVDPKMQQALAAAQAPYAPVTNDNSTNKGLLGVLNKIGHGGSAVGRFLVGNTAKLANTGISEGKQVFNTAQQTTQTRQQTALTQAYQKAVASGNKVDIAKARAALGGVNQTAANTNQRIQNDFTNLNQDHTGILGVGTVFKNGKEAQSGSWKTGVQRIGGTTLGSAGEILPFAEGLGIGVSVASKTGLGAKLLNQTAGGAAVGGIGSIGNQLAQNGRINLKETGKGIAAGGILGAGGTLLAHGLGTVSKALGDTKATGAIKAPQKQLGPGQKQIPAVNESTKKSQTVPNVPRIKPQYEGVPEGALPPDAYTNTGATFGKAATEPKKVATAAEKTKATVASIDEKLAAIDRGEIQVNPQERKDLFHSRQVLSGNAPGVRPETKGLVKAVAEAHANLDVGGSTLSEAVSKATKSGPRTPYTPEVAKTLNAVKPTNSTVSRGKGLFSEVKDWFTPGGGKEGKVVANDLRASMGNTDLARAGATREAHPDIKFFKGAKPGENLNFIQRVESGEKQPTGDLQAMADKFRKTQEDDFKIAQSLKPDITHVDNYFPRANFWDNSSKEVDAFLKKWQKPSLGGSPTALKQRSFPTIYDGIHAGLRPKETNPAIIALNSHTQLLKAKAAQDFINEQIAKGHDPTLVQNYVDRLLEKGMTGSSIYQTTKDAGFALNNLQLGLSGFHVTGTALNAVVSQFSNGLQDVLHGNLGTAVKDFAKTPFAPADYIFKGNKILKDFKGGNITQDIKNIAEGGGRIGGQADYRTNGLMKSIEQIKTGEAKNIAKGIGAAPLRAFSTAAKPIMEWWVPRIKAGATKELIDRKLAELGPKASADAVRAAKAEAIDSIDNRFGQLVKDNLMWKKTIKDGSTILMRSPGWNIGTVRELGGGATDVLSKTVRGKGVSERTTYAASLAATTMLLGTAMSYMFTGKPPQDAKDYFFPKTGQIDKNGNEERVSLPSYAKDVFAFAHNPVQTVGNKLSPGLSIGKDIVTNKDYFGNMVRNPEDSAGTQLKQTGQFLAKNVLPFTITNANQRVDKSAGTKAQSFAGITPAPGYITKSNFEQKVSAALNHATGSKSLTPEEQALNRNKSDAKVSQQGGDSSKIQAMIDSGKITQKQGDNLKKSSGQSSLANTFNYLVSIDKPAAAKLINQASPQDRQKLGDLSELRRSLEKTTRGKAKQSNKDAASKLLQALNK